MDIIEIRRSNLRLIAAGLRSDAELAEKIDRTPSQLSQTIGENPTRNIGGRLARAIELKLGLAKGWLDVVQGDLRYPTNETPQNEKIKALVMLAQQLPEYALDAEIKQVASNLELIRKTRAATRKK